MAVAKPSLWPHSIVLHTTNTNSGPGDKAPNTQIKTNDSHNPKAIIYSIT